MHITRLAAVSLATATLLAVGGTALALAGGDAPAPSSPAAARPTSSTTTSPTATPAAPAVDHDDAAAVALQRVGGGRVTDVEREMEHGRAEWKIEIVYDGVEHDVRVDAATGTITRLDADDRDDRRGDDRRGDDRHGGDRHGSDDGPGHDVGDDRGGDDY